METGCLSKLPIMNSGFISHIGDAFTMISSKYKVDLTIFIDDMGGYTQEQMQDLLEQNFLLEYKSNISSTGRRKMIGYILTGMGVASLLAVLLIEHFWIEESVLREIFFYVADIATTVSFWEAMTIVVVEQAENRTVRNSLKKRLVGIHFVTTPDPAGKSLDSTCGW